MKGREQVKIYTGTSGLVLPVPNKNAYPEAFRDKSRLSYYSSLFNTIEINSSFKKIPMHVTVQKWAAAVPDDFKFTFKLSKWLTHNKGLLFEKEDVKEFMSAVNNAGNKKGCLLIQFPRKLDSAHLVQLKKLLKAVHAENKKEEWKVAVELRHPGWFEKEMIEILTPLKIGLVVHDMPPSDMAMYDTGANFVYLRFHGTEKNYRGDYTDEFLEETSKKIIAWHKQGKEVYAYFNNTLGNAVHNLITLNKNIEGS